MATSFLKKESGMKSFVLIIFIFFIFVTLSPLSPLTVCSVLAADVTLEWDQNSEPDISGYKVYYSVESRNYTTTIDVGNFTSCVISDLDPERTYFFAATAYNTDGYESDFSNEVSYSASSSSPTPTTPSPTTPTPSTGDSGSGGGGSCFIATAVYGTD